MKTLFLSIFSLTLSLSCFSQIHNDLCKEGSYPAVPYNLKNNTTGANLQSGEQSPGAGNTQWNVIVTAPGKNITVAVSPDYCTANPKISKPTIRIYDDLNEQSLDFYYNQCPKPQPMLGPTTQKLKYSALQCGNSASVFFNMPPFGGKEPNGNAYYDIQIDGAAPGAYVLAVVQEDQFGKVGNDFVCDAIQLPAGEVVGGSNCMATAVCDEPVGKQWRDSIKDNTRWFYFDATGDASIVRLEGLNFDGQVAIYDRGLASAAFCGKGSQVHTLLTEVASADCNANNTAEEVYIKTIVGHRYKVQVDGNKSAGNFGVKWINSDVLHPADSEVKSGDTLVFHQNYPGKFYTQTTLPVGVGANFIVNGNDTAFVFSNTTGADQFVTIYFNVGCQSADSVVVRVKGVGNGIGENNSVGNPGQVQGNSLLLDQSFGIKKINFYTVSGQLIGEVKPEGLSIIELPNYSGLFIINYETTKGSFTTKHISE